MRKCNKTISKIAITMKTMEKPRLFQPNHAQNSQLGDKSNFAWPGVKCPVNSCLHSCSLGQLLDIPSRHHTESYLCTDLPIPGRAAAKGGVCQEELLAVRFRIQHLGVEQSISLHHRAPSILITSKTSVASGF